MRLVRGTLRRIKRVVTTVVAKLTLRLEGVIYGDDLTVHGVPIVSRADKSRIVLGARVVLVSDSHYTALGVNHPVVLRTLRPGATLVIGDDVGIAASLIELGKVAMSQKEMICAQSHFEESLALCRELGEKVGIVGSLQNLGQLMMAQNNYESARVLYQESLDIAIELASTRYMTVAKDALESLNQETVSLEVDV